MNSLSQLRGLLDEIGERARPHLSHDPSAVRLDRDLADPEFVRDLFVEESRDDERHDFTFTRRQ